MPKIRTPLPVVAVLVAAPVILIGATFWMASALVPACAIDEHQRLPSPDGQRELVTYSIVCDQDLPNTRATLVAPGAPVSAESTGFAAVALATDLAPRWTEDGTIALTLPPDPPLLAREETVDGIAVRYQ